MATAYVNLHITDPPKFDVSRYEVFRREILWWRDIHASLDDDVLIATLAVKSTDDTLKTVMTGLWKSLEQIVAPAIFPICLMSWTPNLPKLHMKCHWPR